MTLLSSPVLTTLTAITAVVARLDTLTATDYLSISVDCKDTRIKVMTIHGQFESNFWKLFEK